jgi:hypothetical protein
MRSEEPRPHVLIIGGFLTEPVNYRRVRRRLLERDAASVTVAPVHVPDWLAAGVVGFGPLLTKTGRAIKAAHRAAGEPVIVVGHSGGGILARLALCHVPFQGRCSRAAEAVGCLVTLGTPHDLATAPVRIRHRGLEAARFLDASTPGAWFAPRTAYLTVASELIEPSQPAPPRAWDRWRGGLFRSVVGPALGAGDGIVSASLAHLPGARQLTFPDVRHGHIGGPWYGDDEIIDRWWPVAVELWREALAVRRQPAGEARLDEARLDEASVPEASDDGSR